MPDKTILIVDDDLEFCKMLSQYLTGKGFFVHVAHNGEEGLRIIHESVPDLILLDVKMPKKSGFELLQELKANPAHAKIPIIMLTGERKRDSLEKGLTLGADFYIPKPFTLENLMDFVDNILK